MIYVFLAIKNILECSLMGNNVKGWITREWTEWYSDWGEFIQV